MNGDDRHVQKLFLNVHVAKLIHRSKHLVQSAPAIKLRYNADSVIMHSIAAPNMLVAYQGVKLVIYYLHIHEYLDLYINNTNTN